MTKKKYNFKNKVRLSSCNCKKRRPPVRIGRPDRWYGGKKYLTV